MTGPDSGEVPAVQRGDLADAAPLGDGDHRSIRGPHGKVVIALDQLGDPGVVDGEDLGPREVPSASARMKALSARTPA